MEVFQLRTMGVGNVSLFVFSCGGSWPSVYGVELPSPCVGSRLEPHSEHFMDLLHGLVAS